MRSPYLLVGRHSDEKNVSLFSGGHRIDELFHDPPEMAHPAADAREEEGAFQGGEEALEVVQGVSTAEPEVGGVGGDGDVPPVMTGEAGQDLAERRASAESPRSEDAA